MRLKRKIVVGLSGGIDSSVAAFLLKEKGYEVIGLTLKFFPEENRCCDLDSLWQAQQLCYKLGIPHYVINVEDIFKQEVVNYFLKSYLKGLTPNPCAICNQKIKFGVLLDKIRGWEIDALATGHYVRKRRVNDKIILGKAKDKRKSQEYFLGLVAPSSLRWLEFPLGDFTKEEVREIAKKKRLLFIEREESQDICFINDGDYIEFINKSIDNPLQYAGKIKHMNGKLLGSHRGIYHFTYGQRQGLGIAWRAPLYVRDICVENNTVIVGEKEAIFKKEFYVRQLNWFKLDCNPCNLKVKVRYNSKEMGCEIEKMNGKCLVRLKKERVVPSPGQLAVFYEGENMVGGGLIAKE